MSMVRDENQPVKIPSQLNRAMTTLVDRASTGQRLLAIVGQSESQDHAKTTRKSQRCERLHSLDGEIETPRSLVCGERRKARFDATTRRKEPRIKRLAAPADRCAIVPSDQKKRLA